MPTNRLRGARRIRPVPALIIAAWVLIAGGLLAAAFTDSGIDPGKGPTKVGTKLEAAATTTAVPTTPTPETTVAQAAASGTPAVATTAAAANRPSEASARFVIIDPRGPRRSGVPLVVEGPATRTFTSGADGIALVTGPPGRYRLKIPEGCAGQLHITRGASGDLGLAEGYTGTGRLTVDAGLRYVPGAGTSYRPADGGEPDAAWRPGQVQLVEMALHDRCGGRAPAGTVVDRGRFVPGPEVELAGEPTTTVDAAGRVTVPMRCTGGDVDVTLDLVDPELPTRRLAVLTRANLDDQAPPFCRT